MQVDDSNAKDDEDDNSTPVPVKHKETSQKADTGFIWELFNFLHLFQCSVFLVLQFFLMRDIVLN